MAGTLEQKKAEFALLDENVFESIKERTKNIIIEETSNKVKQLASEGKSDDDIISEIISPFVTVNVIRIQIENYNTSCQAFVYLFDEFLFQNKFLISEPWRHSS